MAAQYTHDVVATVGSYRDREGNEKKRFVNIGKCFTQENGRMSIKLDTIPVGPEWSGWLSLYEKKEDRGGSGERSPAARQPAHHPSRMEDMPDIPF